MAHETSAPRTRDSGPERGPSEQESIADPLRTGDPAGEPAGQVSLERLLSVVVLSPAQAVLVAAQLLDATHRAGTTNGANPLDVRRWAVALTPCGAVDLRPAQAGQGAPVAELLEQLSQNARRLPAHSKPEQLVLLRRLEEAAAEPQHEPGARARELEDALAAALGPGAQQSLAGQLTALVGAFAHIASSRAQPVDALAAPGGPPPDPQRAVPTRPTQRRQRGRIAGRRRPRTSRLVLVALLLTVALAGGAFVVLQDPGLGLGGTQGRDEDPAAPPTARSGSPEEPATTPRSRPRPDVAVLAGRSAGPVTAVELLKGDGCEPGAPCPVTVTARLRPAATSQTIAWKVGAARLCGSGIIWSPPVTVTAQPGWSTVYASSTVSLPPDRPIALVALTTAPARAQSAPVPVTGSSLRCPAADAQR